MSLDLTLLKLLKYKENYDKWARAIPEGMVQASTHVLIKDMGMFFKENPDAKAAMPDAFVPYFHVKHPKLPEDKRAIYSAMLQKAGEDVPDAVRDGISSRLTNARIAMDLATMLEKYNAGEEVDLILNVREISDRIPVGGKALPYVTTSIEELLKAEEDDWGFKFRLSCLNSSMRSARPGDFMILAARVDQGKTTMLASELTYFASQIKTLFPETPDRPIIYLNNEGMGSRIRLRMIQAALGVTAAELVEINRTPGEVMRRYQEALGGKENIYILDVHDRPMSDLEDMVARTNPAVVVIDMLDVVPFDGVVGNNGTRTDQLLEAAYQRARIWGVKYGTLVIATSQLGSTAEGVLYPTLSQLANSKTGKAGAADAVIMMGSSTDGDLAAFRWIGLPKNKLARAGQKKDPQAQVHFKGDTARLEDLS
jgi:replicative DNA helicase